MYYKIIYFVILLYKKKYIQTPHMSFIVKPSLNNSLCPFGLEISLLEIYPIGILT